MRTTIFTILNWKYCYLSKFRNQRHFMAP
jgi:hypothetical protein